MIKIYKDTTVGTPEFIALFNPNLEPVDLKGYQFTDDITEGNLYISPMLLKAALSSMINGGIYGQNIFQ